ncbi:unnamed protein product [Closterium sp. NIES-65]|nr:unnamed protein product [Closterium sp. NIES-65]
MAKFIHPPFLAVLVMLVCLSMLPPAFAAGPVRIARTLQAQDVYTGQRQLRRDRARKLTDVVNSGSQPPLHMFETKSIFDKERRGEFSEEQREQVGGATASSAIPIQYHGGPVMSGETLNVYLIYYGFWPAGIGQDVIENFIQSLSLGSSDEQGGPGDPKHPSRLPSSPCSSLFLRSPPAFTKPDCPPLFPLSSSLPPVLFSPPCPPPFPLSSSLPPVLLSPPCPLLSPLSSSLPPVLLSPPPLFPLPSSLPPVLLSSPCPPLSPLSSSLPPVPLSSPCPPLSPLSSSLPPFANTL